MLEFLYDTLEVFCPKKNYIFLMNITEFIKLIVEE